MNIIKGYTVYTGDVPNENPLVTMLQNLSPQYVTCPNNAVFLAKQLTKVKDSYWSSVMILNSPERSKGFSLVSVLICFVMLGFIMAASMQLMQYAMLSANSTEARQGLNNLAQDLRPFTSCTNGVVLAPSINPDTIGEAYALKNVSVILLSPTQIAVKADALKPVTGPSSLKPRIIMTTICEFNDHNNDGRPDNGQLNY